MSETASIALVVAGAAVAIAGWWYPLTATAVFAAGIFIPGVIVGPSWSNELPNGLVPAGIAVSFLAGARLPIRASLAGLALAILAFSQGTLSGSVATLVMTVPAWAAGRVLRSRNTIAAQLDARARELEYEREAYAREQVRYERARIARDLHDLVAHNLTAIAVQAGAGRRALDADPNVTAGLLGHIESGARQAGQEITGLVQLLSNGRGVPGTGLDQLDDLVRRATATGLNIEYTLTGLGHDLPSTAADVAYHVAQEGITNALKHAPGAAIRLHLDTRTDTVAISVENGPSRAAPCDLAQAGGGFGLTGLADRLRILGGTLESGPIPDGGWRLVATMPTVAIADARS
jgi:signal transduction histidine kinase